MLGCILVVFVLLAFLFQWRAAFVSLLAIPLSLGAAAIVLDAEGTTINTMILAGFGVAVGVVVDDAIIDMENIVRRLRNWRARGRRTTPLHLLLAASLEVRTAILYATLINIVAVLPVVFVGGLTGSFFRPLAVAYALAVLASMVVALTVTPALAMVLMPSARLEAEGPAADRVVQARLREAAARRCCAGRAGRSATVVAAIVAGALVLPSLGQDLFPIVQGAGPADALRHQARHLAARDEADRRAPAAAAAADPRCDAGRIAHRPGAARRGDRRPRVLRAVDHARRRTRTWPRPRPPSGAVAASFPGTFLDLTTYLHERIDETITTDTEDIVVRILGPNFGTLQRLSQEVTDKLSGTPNLVDLHPQSQGFIPQIQETVNAAAAARYGLTPGEVRRQAAIIFGTPGGRRDLVRRRRDRRDRLQHPSASART